MLSWGPHPVIIDINDAGLISRLLRLDPFLKTSRTAIVPYEFSWGIWGPRMIHHPGFCTSNFQTKPGDPHGMNKTSCHPPFCWGILHSKIWASHGVLMDIFLGIFFDQPRRTPPPNPRRSPCADSAAHPDPALPPGEDWGWDDQLWMGCGHRNFERKDRKKNINDERLPTPSNRNTSFEKSMTCPKNRKSPGASRTC